MAQKKNNETVDKMLNDIDQLFKEYWLNAKKYNEPYTELLSKLQPYKKAHRKQDLILVLQQKIDTKETFFNKSENTWTCLFAILGLLVTTAGDLFLNYQEYLGCFSLIPKWIVIAIIIILLFIETILFCLEFLKNSKRKNNIKDYYKFVYNYLTQQEENKR